MAGIYIHIPFCKQACHYCNFHFSTSLRNRDELLKALLKEMVIRKHYCGKEQINTIYFGGGTPSLLTEAELAQIMDTIRTNYRVSPTAEVTFETNPDDITNQRSREWMSHGINRLSIGVQSFFETDLQWMNRAHNADQARRSITIVQDAGLTNISIDLIYGGPTLSDDRWEMNLREAIKYTIPHLSCYALTVETGTALDHFIRNKKHDPVIPDDQARQFNMMTHILGSSGYEHYEISNFAFPGNRSLHNSSYWNGARYVGFGPSAHSFNGISRQWNVSNNTLYIQALQNNTIPSEEEQLTTTQRFNEYIMTSIRTIEGIDIAETGRRYGKHYQEALIRAAEPHIQKGWIRATPERMVLTGEGKLFADRIAADLFVDEYFPG